jgi:hypothetical protein
MRHISNHLLPQQIRGKEQDSIEEIMKGERNFPSLITDSNLSQSDGWSTELKSPGFDSDVSCVHAHFQKLEVD